MAFSNPIIAGDGSLIRQSIRSPNYQTGVSGWTINKDGFVEFSDAVIRGSLSANGGLITLDNNGLFIDTANGFIRANDAGIGVFNDDGTNVRMRTDPSFGAFITLLPATTPGASYVAGNVYATVFAAQNNAPVTTISSPRLTTGTFGRIYLVGEDQAGNPATIDLRTAGYTRVMDGPFQAQQSADIDGGLTVDGGVDVTSGALDVTGEVTIGDRLSVAGNDIGRGLVDLSESTVNSGTVTTAESMVLQSSIITFKAGRAYEVKMKGGVQGAAANTYAHFRVRKNGPGGQDLGEFYRIFTGPLSFTPVMATSDGVIFKTGASDVTAQIALDCQANAAGNVTCFASSATPRQLKIYDIGRASSYPSNPTIV